MKNILNKIKLFKNKKAAADLIAIIVSVTIVAALVIGILLFLSNKVRQTAMDEINNTMNTITGIAEANRNNADIVIPGGSSGGEEPEGNPPATQGRIIPEGGIYYVGVTSNQLGDYSSCTAKYEAGDEFPTIVSDGDVYVYEDYEYKYNYSFMGTSWFKSKTQNGWGVGVLDTSKSSYGKILEEANGKPIVSLGFTFMGCKALEKAPAIPSNVTNIASTFQTCKALTDISDLAIPNGVTSMSWTFNGCTSLTNISDLVIPNSVINMSGTFSRCTSLEKAPAIPSSVTNMDSTFEGCTSLTGEIEINVNSNSALCDYCFKGTVKPIKIIGTCSETTKANLAATANCGNVTY